MANPTRLRPPNMRDAIARSQMGRGYGKAYPHPPTTAMRVRYARSQMERGYGKAYPHLPATAMRVGYERCWCLQVATRGSVIALGDKGCRIAHRAALPKDGAIGPHTNV
jgi:hypothetical protein